MAVPIVRCAHRGSRDICCGADRHHVRAMAEALGGEFPVSRYSPSMELHPMFRADVSAKDAAFLHCWTA